MSHNGKIGRLPAKIRTEINRRLHDGENGRKIVAWLNGLNEVKAMLASDFASKPVNDANLSEWKHCGYRDWLSEQAVLAEARRVMAETTELAQTGNGALADGLALWLIGRYFHTARQLTVDKKNPKAWKLLREVCHDVVALRRGDHGAEWLRIENERLKLQRRKYRTEQKKLKPEKNPPLPPLSPDEMEQRFDEIFGTTPYETTSQNDTTPAQSAPPPLSVSTPLGG